MSNNTSPPLESLPGYRLLDRLGQGGYGEVWRAEAPGGLTKAVKFIFGRQDGARAVRELKALERIREVRHPFLLSLERIEVVEGRMVVVTELADGSLRDRLLERLDGGALGIPRVELLRYLREAADALDYLRDHHSLQHLDIKPENILLLSGHVKVADFGLVKSLDAGVSESIVGGMTPTYAAPEVFRGSPTGSSDQYSLAIVYQELLTGTVPFLGGSPAELTLQHLNEEPDLASLSESDRFVVSRALAKRPEYRFSSCAEFVQMLADGLPNACEQPAAARSATAAAAIISRTSTAGATQVFDALDETAWNGPAAPILFNLDPPTPYAVRAEQAPVQEDSEPFALTPTLFLGLGGSSARVLRMLRQRMSAELGLNGPLPAMPFLLMDVDQTSLSQATHGAEKGAGLLATETVSLPLKRPQQYRAKSEQLLGWLGRRWLYNIPRSARTEGIRPLGRLALIDHARQALQRVRRSVIEATSPESVAESEAASGTTFRPGAFRVYVVASISGGAGGGMALDVAYATRAILERAGISEAKIIGLLTYSTTRDKERGELARVNAFSALTELRHLSRPDVAYPGEAGCGLPAASAESPPFDASYLLDFGASAEDPHGVSARTAIVDYLFLDALTPTQKQLDRLRDAAGDPDRVRSFRVEETLSPSGIADAELLQRRLFELWMGDEWEDDTHDVNVGGTNPLVHGAAQFVARHKIDATGLLATTRGARTRGADAAGGVVQTIIAAIGGWIAEKMDAPGPRLRDASQAVRWMTDHLACVERDLTNMTTDHAEIVQEAALAARRVRAAVASMDARIRTISSALRSDPTIPLEAPCEALTELAVSLDGWLQSEYFAPSGGAARVLSDPGLHAGLKAAVQEIARRFVLPQGVVSDGAIEGPHAQQLSQGVDPTGFGGIERRLTAETFAGRPAGSASVTVVECEGISIPHLAAHVVGHRQDYARFAERVHSRRDIDWEPLLDLDSPPACTPAESALDADAFDRPVDATMLVSTPAPAF
ncbi:Tubulin-like protein [Pirellulimonas nuda]|uniref:Tubulin-like protein n=1 Tax=Pirellulimonas nuda TaxID=2528009 RepID=A0A518DAT0_9BACT|nr:tubulin-like doman-containing protein [Pirellulimonas nuda]QDU88589.1 Tubulin-like protein [Pirellulimonas nuda]